jgi:hypothetical protein
MMQLITQDTNGVRSMNRCHLALAGTAILALVLSACGSATPPAHGPGGSATPSTHGHGLSISPTIGASIPPDGPFGNWWGEGQGNTGEAQADNLANDLRYISTDKSTGGVTQGDGQQLASDAQKAEANPPPYDASGYQQAMASYVAAGNDYANGDSSAGDAELQKANTERERWGRAVQPYCPSGGDCIDQRSFASATPST